MRVLSDEFTTHLAGQVTTLCNCWKVTPRNRAARGFTDHDRDLIFAGVTYRARTGLSASDVETQLGLGSSSAEISGALDDEAITDADILSGFYDGAQVEAWLVNWNDVSQRMLLDTSVIGDITREGRHFTAELRGFSTLLDRPEGRLFQASCAADFGDAKCGLDRNNSAYHVEVAVLDSIGTSLFRAGISGVNNGHYTGGRVIVLSGALSGFRSSIARHTVENGVSRFDLWDNPAAPLSSGDLVRIEVGCDKNFATCRDRFANSVNFRGFPHMPGNDFVISYPSSQDLTQS